MFELVKRLMAGLQQILSLDFSQFLCLTLNMLVNHLTIN